MRIAIPIFVAGEVDLEKERKQLMALSSEIISKYHKKGEDIVLIMNSFETLGDKQEVYNDYIENTADIVLFIIDDKMGEKTEKEYKLAEDTFKNKQNRKNHVFLKEFDKENKTPEIEHIENVMADYGSYYTIYKDLDDLKEKVKQYIEEFVDAKIKQTKKSSRIFKIIASVASIIALALAAVGIYNYLHPEPMLVFSGGGSVYNYIKEHPVNGDTIDLRKYPHSIYANLASESAWTLLVEEAYRGNTTNNKFHTICLSADKIDSVFITDPKYKLHLENCCIFELILGHDPLAVYSYTPDSHPKPNSTITVQEVCEQIKKIYNNPKTTRLFTTSEKSGTFRTYNEYIKAHDLTIQSKVIFDSICNLFFDQSDRGYLTELDGPKQPFYVLGSKYYYPKTVKDSIQTLYLMEDNDTVQKPICLYFISTSFENASHTTGQSRRWAINQPIIDFLKKIDAKRFIRPDFWKMIEAGYIITDKNESQKTNQDVEICPLNNQQDSYDVWKKERKRQDMINKLNNNNKKKRPLATKEKAVDRTR